MLSCLNIEKNLLKITRGKRCRYAGHLLQLEFMFSQKWKLSVWHCRQVFLEANQELYDQVMFNCVRRSFIPVIEASVTKYHKKLQEASIKSLGLSCSLSVCVLAVCRSCHMFFADWKMMIGTWIWTTREAISRFFKNIPLYIVLDGFLIRMATALFREHKLIWHPRVPQFLVSSGTAWCPAHYPLLPQQAQNGLNLCRNTDHQSTAQSMDIMQIQWVLAPHSNSRILRHFKKFYQS